MTLPVSDTMRAAIDARLGAIATEERVTLLIAVESGSRAWGFHSPDSDFDVRFVYAHPVDWHLRLGKRRDVIERPIDDELDISGWTLGKALTLAIKGNAVIAEWLQSPVVYLAHPEARADLLAFCAVALRRRPVAWHYLSLGTKQLARAEAPDGSWRLKKFFYALRPALALRWQRVQGEAMPPMDMTALRAGCDLDPGTEASLDALTEAKMALKEAGTSAARFPDLEHLVAAEFEAARDWLAATTDPPPDPTLWDRADALHRDWSKRAG